MKKLAFLISFLLLSTSAFADTPVSVTNAWARPTIGTNLISAMYLNVKNDGKEPIELLSASIPSGTASFHESMENNGMMHMEPLTSIKIAPGETASFEQGHKHVMLENLKEPLKVGDRVKLTLNFGDKSSTTIEVPVSKDEPTTDAENKPVSLTEQQATERLHAGKLVYSCPMHQHVFTDKNETCPICGMNLHQVKDIKDGSVVFEDKKQSMPMDMKDMPMKDMNDKDMQKMMESK